VTGLTQMANAPSMNRQTKGNRPIIRAHRGEN
jgi:hypothetical protein